MNIPIESWLPRMMAWKALIVDRVVIGAGRVDMDVSVQSLRGLLLEANVGLAEVAPAPSLRLSIPA